jgi:hypothetical protein
LLTEDWERRAYFRALFKFYGLAPTRAKLGKLMIFLRADAELALKVPKKVGRPKRVLNDMEVHLAVHRLCLDGKTVKDACEHLAKNVYKDEKAVGLRARYYAIKKLYDAPSPPRVLKT